MDGLNLGLAHAPQGSFVPQVAPVRLAMQDGSLDLRTGPDIRTLRIFHQDERLAGSTGEQRRKHSVGREPPRLQVKAQYPFDAEKDHTRSDRHWQNRARG